MRCTKRVLAIVSQGMVKARSAQVRSRATRAGRAALLLSLLAIIGVVVGAGVAVAGGAGSRETKRTDLATSTSHPSGPLHISCASAHLCVAVDGAGDVVTSTNPAAGHSAWTVANVDGTHPLRRVSC